MFWKINADSNGTVIPVQVRRVYLVKGTTSIPSQRADPSPSPVGKIFKDSCVAWNSVGWGMPYWPTHRASNGYQLLVSSIKDLIMPSKWRLLRLASPRTRLNPQTGTTSRPCQWMTG